MRIYNCWNLLLQETKVPPAPGISAAARVCSYEWCPKNLLQVWYSGSYFPARRVVKVEEREVDFSCSKKPKTSVVLCVTKKDATCHKSHLESQSISIPIRTKIVIVHTKCVQISIWSLVCSQYVIVYNIIVRTCHMLVVSFSSLRRKVVCPCFLSLHIKLLSTFLKLCLSFEIFTLGHRCRCTHCIKIIFENVHFF
jgi:hypothetical protein